MELSQRISEVANYMLKKGFSVIPISPESKSPIIKWKHHIGTPMEKWEFDGANIAILTGIENGYVVVDCDSEESYLGWISCRPHTPLKVRTKKGMHFYYRHPGRDGSQAYVMSNSRIKADEGFTYDVKGDKSYCLMPPSMNGYHQYQVCVCRGNLRGKWMCPGDLPPFDPAWRPVTEYSVSGINNGAIRDANKVLLKIFAMEGERDVQTYHATMVCIEAGLSEGEAIQAILQWHITNVSPPWTPAEIVAKVRRVYSEKAGVLA
jgi:hypothetical protein